MPYELRQLEPLAKAGYWTREGNFYVTELPTEEGKWENWGYGFDSEKALPLAPYWQRRFWKDCQSLGRTALFIRVEN